MNLREIREELENNQTFIDEFEKRYFSTSDHQQHIYLRNFVLGLVLLGKRHYYSDGKINRMLIYSAKKLEAILETEKTEFPDKDQALYVYLTACAVGDTRKIRGFYDFYPVLNLCFDENFLVFANYLIGTDIADDELKEKIESLVKEVKEFTKVKEIIPIEGINDLTVDKKTYHRLCDFTLDKIKAKEKRIKKENKKKVKELKKELKRELKKERKD